jgi:hypothetical protein
MNTTHNPKKMIVGALLSGGLALAGFGLTAGIAQAAPSGPGPFVDYSDFAGPLVECIQCGQERPGDGSVRINPGAKIDNGLLLPATPGDGSVRTAPGAQTSPASQAGGIGSVSAG